METTQRLALASVVAASRRVLGDNHPTVIAATRALVGDKSEGVVMEAIYAMCTATNEGAGW